MSLIPKFIVEEELLNGSLKQIGKEYKIVPESSIYAVYPSKKYMAAKTKALLDFLKVSMVE
ncbi:hypothetical protein JCM19233_6956 [Vibrio astriarenae]|nr:hypothetical protein JCM19233_6956 [Vibrio sp. C7]